MPLLNRRAWLFGGGVTTIIFIIVVITNIYKQKLYISLPDYPAVSKVYWLNQGWNEKTGEKFHHADQGTQTLGIPYEWFVALEQPRIALVGDVGRLNDPVFLDRFGFIPGATTGGEAPPPIGFAKSEQPVMFDWDGKPWRNPQTGEQHHAIGFTCAACHTGRFTYSGNAVIVDGAPALTDLEKFRQAIGVSILFTRYVPWRFDRFARNVLGERVSTEAKDALQKQLDAVWTYRINPVRLLDQGVRDASVDEGFGRLDALNRIGNQVFSLDLVLAPKPVPQAKQNYHGWSAPVSYPHIWMTSYFDWVQWNASIMQPMVRNAGQALGVGAPLQIAADGSTLFGSGVNIANLFAIEQSLSGEWPYTYGELPKERGTPHHPFDVKSFKGLRAPSWPAGVLPEIRLDRAAEGLRLYGEHCQKCHRPPVGSSEIWNPEYWERAGDGRHVLKLVALDAAAIGTDPAQARDMNERKVWVPGYFDKKGDPAGSMKPFADELGAVVAKTVEVKYAELGMGSPDKSDLRDFVNGDRPNLVQKELVYKARPLDGVWATAPFLHNGSVPSVYALLSPQDERPKTFLAGRREYDPLCMGYRLNAVPRLKLGTPEPERDPQTACLDPEAGSGNDEIEGLFLLRTGKAARPGNVNTGHRFEAAEGTPKEPLKDGMIGVALKPEQRLAIIEFLKTDCANGREADKVVPPRISMGGRDTTCEALKATSR